MNRGMGRGQEPLRTQETMPRVILASASPRRQALLAQIGVPFTVCAGAVDEEAVVAAMPAADAAERAQALALEKARDVARRCGMEFGASPAGVRIIGADTVVVCDGRMLGKPSDAADADAMLRLLSGRAHDVITGVALVDGDGGTLDVFAERTRVWFREIGDAERKAYIQSGEPMDKAGGYAVQGRAAVFVVKIDGNYDNVVGLPLARLAWTLARHGVPVHRCWKP